MDKKLNASQRKFLNDRIRDLAAVARHRVYGFQAPRSPKVEKAFESMRESEKIIEEWEKENGQERERLRRQINEGVAKAKEALLFMGPEEALAAVKELEALVDKLLPPEEDGL